MPPHQCIKNQECLADFGNLRERVAVIESLLEQNTRALKRMGAQLDKLTTDSVRQTAWGRGAFFGARVVVVGLLLLAGAGLDKATHFIFSALS